MIRRLAVPAGKVVLSDEAPARKRRAAALPRPRSLGSVVLLHGFTGSKASWTHLRAALRRRRRVIALDLPGHGETIMGGRGFDFSLEHTAEVVVGALDTIGVSRFALVGYSMGGRLALQLALAHPGCVERLVLESAAPGLATARARARRRRADDALAAAIETAGIAAFVRRWETLPLFRSLTHLPAPTREVLRRERLACSPAGLAASLRGMGTGVQPWLGRRLNELAMPVLLVAGTLDRKFTRIARRLAARIPRSRLAIVNGAGHIPHLEQPVRFRRVVGEFLGDRARSHRSREEEIDADLMA